MEFILCRDSGFVFLQKMPPRPLARRFLLFSHATDSSKKAQKIKTADSYDRIDNAAQESHAAKEKGHEIEAEKSD